MEKENNTCSSEKSCENCQKNSIEKGCCHCKKCHILKKILLIVVLILIFGLGIQVGEMKSSMHRYNGCEIGNLGNGGGFMQRNIDYRVVNDQPQTITVPTTPQSPVAPKQ